MYHLSRVWVYILQRDGTEVHVHIESSLVRSWQKYLTHPKVFANPEWLMERTLESFDLPSTFSPEAIANKEIICGNIIT